MSTEKKAVSPKPHPNKGRPHNHIPDERYAAARVLYETTPGMTFIKLAEETGMSVRALEERSRGEGTWSKCPLLPNSAMSERAQVVADVYTAKVADYGDDISKDQKLAAMRATAEDVAVDMRAQVLDRHRREWQPIRNRVYKQLDPRTQMDEKTRFEMSKTTKINAETLAILQLGERKAWGLDKPGEGDGGSQGVTVVIERS